MSSRSRSNFLPGEGPTCGVYREALGLAISVRGPYSDAVFLDLLAAIQLRLLDHMARDLAEGAWKGAEGYGDEWPWPESAEEKRGREMIEDLTRSLEELIIHNHEETTS